MKRISFHLKLTVCLLCFSISLFATSSYSNIAEEKAENLEEFLISDLRDSLALIALYDATGGVNWTIPWDLSQPMDTWHGVTVNADGCVIELGLNNNNLIEPIPAEIGELSKLIELDLSYNQLSGSIPDFLNLPNLTRLELWNNQLSGNIPDFSNLPNLTTLYLDENQLSGPIPDFSNLPNLTELSLYNNQLSGPIPDFLNLPKMAVECRMGWW